MGNAEPEVKMGRPPKPKHLKQTKRVVFLLTEGERAQVSEFIASEGFEGDADLVRTALFKFMAERGSPIKGQE